MIKDFIERKKREIQHEYDVNKVCSILEQTENLINYLIEKKYSTHEEIEELYKLTLTSRDFITYEMKEFFSDWQGNDIDQFIENNFNNWITDLRTNEKILNSDYDNSLIRHITIELNTYIYYKLHEILEENLNINEEEKKEIIEVLYEIYGYDYDYYEFQMEGCEDEDIN